MHYIRIMKKDKRIVDGYTMGELSQLARRRMITRVKESGKVYSRKRFRYNDDCENE